MHVRDISTPFAILHDTADNAVAPLATRGAPVESLAPDVPEPTLAAMLTRLARTAVPERLYQLLWIGVPFAVDFGVHGWPRAAAWGVVVAALGAWGVADRRCYEQPEAAGWRRSLLRVARAGTGLLAAGLAAALLIERFLRLLGNAPIS